MDILFVNGCACLIMGQHLKIRIWDDLHKRLHSQHVKKHIVRVQKKSHGPRTKTWNV